MARIRTGLLGEIVGMSVDTLRTNKMRSALTVLGIVIGITSIVGMTSLIRGFDQTLRDSIRELGPNTIYVQKMGALSITAGKTQSADLGQLARASDPARAAYEAIRRARGHKPPVQEVRNEALGPGLVRVPDLTGFPVREALARGVELGVKPRIVGTGLLSRQEPPPGATLQKGETLVMVFEPAT